MTASATYWPRPQSPLAAVAQSYIARRTVKLFSYCALACLLGVLALVATATAPVLFGYHTYTVDGGSMEPALKRGSVAIAASTSPPALHVGDIIAYRQSPQNPPVLHRIVQITNDNGQLGFITQGDQNQTPDTQPVVLQGPGDKVEYMVPYAGYILDFAHSTLGRILLIGLPLLTTLGMFLAPGKRPADSKNESGAATEPNVPPAESTPARATERPSLETQALQRGLFSPTLRALESAPQPVLEGQALQDVPSSPTMRPIGRERASQPTLEAQAFQRGLLLFRPRIAVDRRAQRPRWRRRPSARMLRTVPPAVPEAGPAPQRRAA